MTKFIIFSGRSPLLELPLGTTAGDNSFEVQETARIGFEVDDFDERVPYQVMIGDMPLAEEPQEHRTCLRWPASPYLDGASGITPISLRDKGKGITLVRSLALVEPSKLSARAYEIMFDDMRRISVELLLDLISKSRRALSRRAPPRNGGVRPLTARLELGQIRRFWQRFSLIVAAILEEPNVELRNRNVIRRAKPGERLKAGVLRRFAQQGLRAREAVRSGGLLELPTAIPDRDTRENRVMVGFIDLLQRRVERSLKRARAERDMRIARLRSYRANDTALKRFVERREEPKIAKLQEIIETSEGVATEMRRAIRGFEVPVKRIGLQGFLESFDSPTFRSHPQYSQAGRMMHAFLNNSSIVVEQGATEGAKAIETIFEQWVFFQVSAAIQASGLSCISHNSIFEPIARDRFSVDLDRNAAIVFEGPDKRIARLRYEPTILPRQAAQGMDSLYRGHSASPWTPDIVLEILVPGADPRDYRLAYAAVIDAKYTTSGNVWDRLHSIERYREIRSVDTDSQITRQVWIAAPIAASLQPRDDAVTWSLEGEVGADPLDVILGVIGADPADPLETATIFKALILGFLQHSLEFSRAAGSERRPH
ncbi:MAG TPA: nuclease domain-containing protein [Devosiaceae bacterium]